MLSAGEGLERVRGTENRSQAAPPGSFKDRARF